jgi:hypothetical protein
LTIAVAFILALGLKGLLYFGMMLLVYSLEEAFWMRYYIKEISFGEKEVCIGYLYYNAFKITCISYEELSVEKRRVWYKTKSAQYYLRFKKSDKLLFRQFEVGELNNNSMDIIRGKLQYYKLEIAGNN